MDDLMLYVPRRYDVYKRTNLGGNNLGIWFARDAITKIDVVIKFGVRQHDIDRIILLNEKCPSTTVPYIDSFHAQKFEVLVTQKFDGTLADLLIETRDLEKIEVIAEMMIKAYMDLVQCGYVEQNPSLDNIVYNLYEDDLIDIRFIDYGESGKYDDINEILNEFMHYISQSRELSKAKIEILTEVISNQIQQNDY